jgi:hypothetical protein
MANSVAHDKMCTLWEEVLDETEIKLTLSKDLSVWNMNSEANMNRTADADDNNVSGGNDREYIPQDLRFTTQDGIVSTDGDIQDDVDRMVPVNRGKAIRILSSIDAKELRDPSRREKKAKAFAREIANKVDITCYQTMINQASMAHTTAADFEWQDGVDAELLMLNHGLGAFDRKLFLSNRHYGKVAKELGQYSRETFTREAVTRARIPDLATFETMRSDYLLTLSGNTSTGLAINGDQSHTPATYDADGFYLDNRSMSLAVTGSTPTTMPVGTKFTIAGIDAVNPETRTPNGELQTFTVTATGTGTVTVMPAIVATGPYQNCSAIASASAAITILNIADNNPSLFYTPESTYLVPGRLPASMDGEGVKTVELTTQQGLPMRLTYWYDGHKEKVIMKALVYFDVQVVQPNQVGAILDKQV